MRASIIPHHRLPFHKSKHKKTHVIIYDECAASVPMRLFLRRSQKEIVRYLLAPQSTGPFQPDRKRLAPDVVVAAMPTAGPTGVFDGRPIFRQYGRSGGAAYVAQVAVGIAGFVVEIIDADDGEDRVAAVRNVSRSPVL